MKYTRDNITGLRYRIRDTPAVNEYQITGFSDGRVVVMRERYNQKLIQMRNLTAVLRYLNNGYYEVISTADGIKLSPQNPVYDIY